MSRPARGTLGAAPDPSPQQVSRPSVMCISLADPASHPDNSHTEQNQYHCHEGPQG
jgi:hypothetical protein